MPIAVLAWALRIGDGGNSKQVGLGQLSGNSQGYLLQSTCYDYAGCTCRTQVYLPI